MKGTTGSTEPVTADQLLVFTDQIKESLRISFDSHGAKLTDVRIALAEIPGNATSIKIERLGRRNVYAVEIISDKDGGEWDVFVDIETGEIVGTDN